jgi:hypothetical protein
MLTDERIERVFEGMESAKESPLFMRFARAVEAEATAHLLARIAELEKELAFTSEMNDQLREQLEADTKRLGFVEVRLFGKSWNGVIDSGSRTDWRIASDHRHITRNMVGHTFRDAIDNAMKEQP